MIRIIIVDDEPHALEDLEKKIGADGEFDIVARCANAFEAIKEINSKQPDVVFLDIKMPRISGIEMLSMLDKDNMPRIVFVTAYGEYAIEAFKKNAIDFLLKPVKSDRLNITLARLKENHQPQPVVTETFSTDLKFVPCYLGNQYYLINIREVIYAFSSPTTGTHLVTGDDGQEFHTNLPLKVFDDNSQLVRCHRQHVINSDYIKFIEKLENGLGRIHTYGDQTIPVSRNYMDNFPSIA
ncbi:MAG: two-component system response regulator BtsR [Candidatus Polarisedimenticolaceae bacterium]|nr:two-component system response regulator BtsR [Candidatus Polarisedimenticolaceae bacterium]